MDKNSSKGLGFVDRKQKWAIVILFAASVLIQANSIGLQIANNFEAGTDREEIKRLSEENINITIKSDMRERIIADTILKIAENLSKQLENNTDTIQVLILGVKNQSNKTLANQVYFRTLHEFNAESLAKLTNTTAPLNNTR